ncbi:MAG: class I SAM-dependent methyltransferase [Phycisphaerales bacterium]
MPSSDQLAALYSADYGHDTEAVSFGALGGRFARLLSFLASSSPGRLLDVGCADGHVLELLHERGWRVEGLESQEEVAAATRLRTGLPVATSTDQLMLGPYDFIFLGDVLEHLPEPAPFLVHLITLLGPNGRIIAQGPLEAEPTLFLRVMKMGRHIRRQPIADMAPFHVSLSTCRGQSDLFARVGLQTVQLTTVEAPWPAPGTLSDIHGAREALLFALHKISYFIPNRVVHSSGNRYFYVGSVQAVHSPVPPTEFNGWRRLFDRRTTVNSRFRHSPARST